MTYSGEFSVNAAPRFAHLRATARRAHTTAARLGRRTAEQSRCEPTFSRATSCILG